ncbi:MAG TPA: DUF1579 family protein [Tepidisphaeraceae bacterium]|nr:DUF1579 family protein [Tepidisphaeraceae bacterium]
MRLGSLLAVVLLLSAVTAIAQEKKDAQSSYEPRSGPGAGQKFLAHFVGQWEVTKTFYPRSGQPSIAKGECRQTMINDGRFLKSEFVFHSDSGDTTGLGLIGFEPESGRFTSVWMDSRQTRMSLRQSKEPFNGSEIVLFSKSLDQDGRPARQSRTITHLEDGGKKIVHRQFSAGSEGKERLVMELVMMARPGQ